MPLHRIYTEPGLYSASDKHAFAKAITSYYEAIGLPKFYCVVIFQEIPVDSFFIGDQTYDERKAFLGGKAFVRVLSQHIARAARGRERRHRMTDGLEKVFKPFIADRGYDWEFNVEESEGDVARNGGYPLPAPGSEAEKRWKEDDKTSAYEGATMAEYFDQQAAHK